MIIRARPPLEAMVKIGKDCAGDNLIELWRGETVSPVAVLDERAAWWVGDRDEAKLILRVVGGKGKPGGGVWPPPEIEYERGFMNPKLEEIVQRIKNLDRANLREFALVIQSVSHTGFDVGLILTNLCDFFTDMDHEDGDFRMITPKPEDEVTDEILASEAQVRHYRYVCRKCGSTTRSIRANKRKCPACGRMKLVRKESES